MLRDYFSDVTYVKKWVYQTLWAHLILTTILDLVR